MIVIQQAATDQFRLGLEQEGKQLYELAASTYEIPVVNGKLNHGLTPDEAKIVEAFYGLQFDNPDHRSSWTNIVLEIKHSMKVINPSNPQDLLLLGVLKANGILATSTEDVQMDPQAKYVFVLRNEGDEERQKATLYERLDENITRLSQINKESKKYLMALAKYLTNSLTIGTDQLAYTKLRDYIDGKYTRTQKEALNRFETTLEMDKTRLYTIVDVKEALYRNIIRRDINQRFYNPLTTTVYGKTEEEVVDFLMRVENQDELGVGVDAPPYSIRKQLTK